MIALWHRLLCFLGQHYGHVESDNTGLWHQCAHCGKRTGFVPRSQLDALIDRELELRK